MGRAQANHAIASPCPGLWPRLTALSIERPVRLAQGQERLKPGAGVSVSVGYSAAASDFVAITFSAGLPVSSCSRSKRSV